MSSVAHPRCALSTAMVTTIATRHDTTSDGVVLAYTTAQYVDSGMDAAWTCRAYGASRDLWRWREEARDANPYRIPKYRDAYLHESACAKGASLVSQSLPARIARGAWSNVTIHDSSSSSNGGVD